MKHEQNSGEHGVNHDESGLAAGGASEARSASEPARAGIDGALERDPLHEELCAYVLGELEGEAVARVEAALADSAEWRAERERLSATIGLVQEHCALGEESLSAEAHASLLARASLSAPDSTGAGQAGPEADGASAAALASARSSDGSEPVSLSWRSSLLRAAAAVFVLGGSVVGLLEWLDPSRDPAIGTTEEVAQASQPSGSPGESAEPFLYSIFGGEPALEGVDASEDAQRFGVEASLEESVEVDAALPAVESLLFDEIRGVAPASGAASELELAQFEKGSSRKEDERRKAQAGVELGRVRELSTRTGVVGGQGGGGSAPASKTEVADQGFDREQGLAEQERALAAGRVEQRVRGANTTESIAAPQGPAPAGAADQLASLGYAVVTPQAGLPKLQVPEDSIWAGQGHYVGAGDTVPPGGKRGQPSSAIDLVTAENQLAESLTLAAPSSLVRPIQEGVSVGALIQGESIEQHLTSSATRVTPDVSFEAHSLVQGSDDFFLGFGGSRLDTDADELAAWERETLRGLGYAGDDGEEDGARASSRARLNRSASGLTVEQALELLERDQDVLGRVPLHSLSDEQLGRLVDGEARRRMRLCQPRPKERPRDMFFRFWGDNAFELSALDPLSTFAVDVDTASYTLARSYVLQQHLPEKAQVRTEEFLNYFDPDLELPSEGTFAIRTELAPSLFGGREDRWLLRVGVRGREVSAAEQLPLSLTFVIDNSGSMKEGNRLQLVKHALRLLVAQLDARDQIGLVVFADDARVILPMTSAGQRGLIELAIEQMQPEGSTNAEAGLRFGYELAAADLSAHRNHRVVLFSDGVANTGETDQVRILESVRRQSQAGIYLNTIGVGMNNHNDVFLEQLADGGDGICDYVDDAAAAQRAIVERFSGAFQPIASDVKIQVEFDPLQVSRYRLLGYENRAIADRDFRNDAVDAGEVGSGHQVVALYELERASGGASEAPLAQVRLRWLPPKSSGMTETRVARELSSDVRASEALADYHSASPGFRLSTLVAQYAEFLRRSTHARGDSYDLLSQESERLARELSSPEVVEFAGLVRGAARLILEAATVRGELERVLDEYRRCQILERELEYSQAKRDAELLDALQRQNRALEERIRDVIRGQLRGH